MERMGPNYSAFGVGDARNSTQKDTVFVGGGEGDTISPINHRFWSFLVDFCCFQKIAISKREAKKGIQIQFSNYLALKIYIFWRYVRARRSCGLSNDVPELF